MHSYVDEDPTRPDITHACPPVGGDGLMPCCGRTPNEVPRWHRITLESGRVTCGKEAGR